MNTTVLDSNPFSEEFDWKRQPNAEHLVRSLLQTMLDNSPFVANLAGRMLEETGTRLLDWVDHLSVPESMEVDGASVGAALKSAGFQQIESAGDEVWYRNGEGIFPEVSLNRESVHRAVIRVDSVVDFLVAHQFSAAISGASGGRFRKSLVTVDNEFQFWVCERHGWQSWETASDSAETIQAAREVLDAFVVRQRCFSSDHDGFEKAAELIRNGIDRIGVDWTCDLFFEAERRYWQARNAAGRQQYALQQSLGLGWGNHDHHTYRSSRKHFADLVANLELLGFHCRERFYAGADAGWGAQVLEQAVSGITIFADVDLSPEELVGDFAHEGLDEKDTLGTVGLWCQLHGEAYLQAGMHHLECQFDFSKARERLASIGYESMMPFTDFEFLRQSFTVGERWSVLPERVEEAKVKGWISADDAERFLADGAVGSHLEVLERNEGFKGFNQSGVSDIIAKTDPRKL